jgi:hypothetical protein
VQARLEGEVVAEAVAASAALSNVELSNCIVTSKSARDSALSEFSCEAMGCANVAICRFTRALFELHVLFIESSSRMGCMGTSVAATPIKSPDGLKQAALIVKTRPNPPASSYKSEYARSVRSAAGTAVCSTLKKSEYDLNEI